jgi:hypothetical protein
MRNAGDGIYILTSSQECKLTFYNMYDVMLI